jgi:hypothetical protein
MIRRFSLHNKKFDTDADTSASGYFPSIFKTYLDSVPDENYILGVQYSDTNAFQIGITGTPHMHEDSSEALDRELAEELQIQTNHFQHKTTKIESDMKLWSCALVNIDTCKPIQIPYKDKQNCYDRKVGILVHGTELNILSLLKNNYNNYIPNDDISHIVMIKASLIKNNITKLCIGEKTIILKPNDIDKWYVMPARRRIKSY